METNRINIFAPNLIINCVDEAKKGCCLGRLYHSYSPEPCYYSDIMEMIFAMEKFYDDIGFPMASTESRSFFKAKHKMAGKERIKLVQDQLILDHKGKRATFIIQVQYRQNSTWQGDIIWSEGNKKQHFRSALELMKLMDEALTKDMPKGESENAASINAESVQSKGAS